VLDVNGLLTVERRVGGVWNIVASIPSQNGPVNAQASFVSYDAERGNIDTSLNFVVPASIMTGLLRFTVDVASPFAHCPGNTASGQTQVDVNLTQTLNAAIVVATFAYVPRIVEGVVNRVQGLLIDTSSLNSRYSLSLGLGRFFDADTASPMLLALIGRIDVFTIWVTVLIAIGLAVTGKISRGRAAIAAAIVWLAGALPSVAGALSS
jgi:hypothetical protein